MSLLKKKTRIVNSLTFDYWVNEAWKKKNSTKLIFIHGLGEPPMVWERLVRQIREIPLCIIKRPEYNNNLNDENRTPTYLMDDFLSEILSEHEIKDIYLIGHSLGSYFALYSKLNIKGRIIIAPFYRLHISKKFLSNQDSKEQINKGFTKNCSREIKSNFTSLVNKIPINVKKQEYRLYNHLIISEAKILKKETMIIRPLEDKVISKRQINQLYSIIPGNKEIIYVPNTGHNIIYESPKIIKKIILDYVD